MIKPSGFYSAISMALFLAVATARCGSVRYFPTIAAMKAATPANEDVAIVSGYYRDGDLGGGTFVFLSASSAAIDDGMVFGLNSGGGRYSRIQVSQANVRMFGAKGNGASDAASFTKAIVFCKSNGYKSLLVPAGRYLIDSVLPPLNDAHKYVSIHGEGGTGSTTLIGGKLGPMRGILETDGGSGNGNTMTIENLAFEGNASGVGIKIQGTCGVHIEKCQFNSLGYGIMFRNPSPKEFTEYCVADNCMFKDCQSALVYTVGTSPNKTGIRSNNPSFQGSGLRDCRIDQEGPAGTQHPQIQIGLPGVDDAVLFHLYNAPLDFQIWTRAAGSAPAYAIIETRVSSASKITTHGTITLEQFNAVPVLARGSASIYHVGGILSWGKYSPGNLRLVDKLAANPDGTISKSFKPFNRTAVVDQSPQTLISEMGDYSGESGCLITVFLSSSHYDYRYLLFVTHDGSGKSGGVQVVSQYRGFDQFGAYGPPPVFTMSPTGELAITAPGYVGKKVNVQMHITASGARKENLLE